MFKYFLIILSIICINAHAMEVTLDFTKKTCAQLKNNFNCLNDDQKIAIQSKLSDHKKLVLQTALQIPELTHHIIRLMTYDDEQTALLFSIMPFAHALLRLCRIEDIFKSTQNVPLLLAKKKDVALSAYFYFGPGYTKTLIYIEKAIEPSMPHEMYEFLKKYRLISKKKCYPLYPVYTVHDHAIPMPEGGFKAEDRHCVIL